MSPPSRSTNTKKLNIWPIKKNCLIFWSRTAMNIFKCQKTLGKKKLIYDPKFWLVAELKTFSGIPLPWENDEELSTFFIIDYCNLEYNMVNFLNLTLLLGQVSLLCQKTFLFVSWPLWKKFWVVLQKNLQSALVLSVLTLPTESEEKSRIIEYFLPF